MKKIAFFAAAALCGSMAMAQDVSVAPVAPVAPEAEAVSYAETEAVLDEMIVVLTEVVEVLESVNDQATADAAAAKLVALKDRAQQVQDKMAAMGELDDATEEKLSAKLMPVLFMLAPRMEAAGMNIVENNFYGSTALEAVLNEQ